MSTVTVNNAARVVSVQSTGTKGLKGDQGDAATVEIGTVETVSPGTPASVVNSGDEHAAVLNFQIPKGDTGNAATIEVNAVETAAPGQPAQVQNVGDEHNALFNFSIPQGFKGDTGDAFEHYGVAIYNQDGIEPKGYYAERYADAASIQTKLYAEIVTGDPGASVFMWVEIGGEVAYGPFTLMVGSPLFDDQIALPVAEGDAVTFVVSAIAGGTVTELFAKTYGAVS